MGRDAEARPAPRADERIGPEALRVHAVGHDVDAVWRCAECDRPSPQVRAARRDRACAPEDPARGAPRRPQCLGHVDVRAVEADDEREMASGGRRDHSAGDHPVTVHDGRAIPSRHGAGGAPARRERQRRSDVRRGFQADVGAQRRRVSEDIEPRGGRVLVKVKVNAALLICPRDKRVPRRDNVHFVTARRDRCRDRLHERPDAVPVEPRYSWSPSRRRDASRCLAKQEPPGGNQRFDEYRARHFRLALPALDEDDRNLADSAAATAGFEQHLYQKGVTVRDHLAERQARQRLPSPASESARAVARSQARDQPDIAVGERAQEESMERPVHDAHAVEVARADYDVVSVVAATSDGRYSGP